MLEWINKKRNKKGFTLVELVIVIAILGILVAIAVPKLSRSRLTAQVATHNANVRILKSAAAMYMADNPTEMKIEDGGLKKYLDDGKMPVTVVKVGTVEAKTDYTVELFKGDIVVTPGEAKISTDGKTVEFVTPQIIQD